MIDTEGIPPTSQQDPEEFHQSNVGICRLLDEATLVLRALIFIWCFSISRSLTLHPTPSDYKSLLIANYVPSKVSTKKFDKLCAILNFMLEKGF